MIDITVTTLEQRRAFLDDILRAGGTRLGFYTRQKTLDDFDDAMLAMERAVIQSPQIQQALADTKRIDWLADAENTVGNVLLPTECVTESVHSLRDAIDAATRL